MLEDARTYRFHSGRDVLRKRLEDLGLLLNQDELNHAFAGFMSLTDVQAEVSDEDLVRIAQNGRRAADGVFDAIGHVYR
jgi:isopropylmalate/homocitrate/citramalate synthase